MPSPSLLLCSDISFDPKASARVYSRYGKGKAFVYLNGKPYYFTFRPQQCLSRPALTINDVAISVDDAKRLPWKTVSNLARIVVGGPRNTRPLCVRLSFSTKFDLKDTAGLKQNQIIFLARPVRALPSRIVRDRAMEAMSRATTKPLLLLAKEDNAQEEECLVCYDNASDAKFAPCGNVGVCAACAFKITQTTKTCPLCRKDISFFTRAAAVVAVAPQQQQQ